MRTLLQANALACMLTRMLMQAVCDVKPDPFLSQADQQDPQLTVHLPPWLSLAFFLLPPFLFVSSFQQTKGQGWRDYIIEGESRRM